ncbi:hypothetical protein BD779DRAFT_1538536 [Infundibulicybe gibba]|nr:hypothetical protein BD779DRAFT_1538536 [Infundibulicybe gibba]
MTHPAIIALLVPCCTGWDKRAPAPSKVRCCVFRRMLKVYTHNSHVLHHFLVSRRWSAPGMNLQPPGHQSTLCSPLRQATKLSRMPEDPLPHAGRMFFEHSSWRLFAENWEGRPDILTSSCLGSQISVGGDILMFFFIWRQNVGG